VDIHMQGNTEQLVLLGRDTQWQDHCLHR
jgi:hypothetical protein